MKTGFGHQSSFPALELCSTSGMDTQTQHRERSTYQRSLLEEKQQHFNTEQKHNGAVNPSHTAQHST
jgi:hypothetical protein